MSGTGEGQRARGGYDPAELCRCIVVCFSTAELRGLAESMGAATDISWGRGTSEAARDLVRHFERKRDLEALVSKLREAKPLVEWPEAAPEAPSPPEVMFAPTSAPLAPTSAPLAPTSAPLANPGVLVGQSAPPLIDPFLAKPAGPAATVINAPPKPAEAESDLTTTPRPLGSPPSDGFSWPGTVGGPGTSAQAPGRGIDPKILVIVSGFTLLAALIAFIAGRAASSGGPPPDASGSPTTIAGKEGQPRGADANATSADGSAPGPAGPAAILADDIARALANVARACEIPIRGAAGEDVLLRVFNQCGPQAAVVRPLEGPVPPSVDGPPSGAKPGENGGAAAAPRAPTGGGAGAQRPAQRPDAPPVNKAPGSECAGKCSSEQQSCNARCGKEPTQGTLYNEYTGCLGRCLSTASRCRLGCK